jgi:hypothetical protein
MTPAEREALIRRYAEGPALFRHTLAKVPPQAMTWRPGPGRWSVHEVVVHCADSETNAHMRIRYLTGEPDPLIVGYNQDRWPEIFDYHAHPLEPALATIEAVRANTVPLLRRLDGTAWSKMARHSESGPYGPEDWLRTYGEHLEIHSRQIERNLKAWEAMRGKK